MKVPSDNLTNTDIGKLEPKSKEYVVSDTEIKKLKIRVTSKAKTFYLYWKKDGRLNKYRIGLFGDIGLPAARKAAEKLLAKISLDENPPEDRIATRKTTAREASSKLDAFLNDLYYPWAKSHQKAFLRTKQSRKVNWKTFHNRRMSSITKSDIDGWQKEQLVKGKKPSTINRQLTALVAALNKAVEWEIIENNPIKGRRRLKVDSGGVVRYLSPDEEVGGREAENGVHHRA